MTRTQEGSGVKCCLLVHASVALRESQLMHLIAAVPGCLVDFDVPACGANATVPFEVHPNCGLMRELQQDFQRSALPNH